MNLARALALLIFCAFTFAGCASPSGWKRDPSAPIPADFSVSVTIYPHAQPSPKPALAPAWFVMQPDRELRVALGVARPRSPLPPVVRTLSREQAEDLWVLVRDGGLLESGIGAAGPTLDTGLDAPAGVRPATDPTMLAVVHISHHGRRRTFALREADAAYMESVERLAARLRELAWLAPAPS